VWRFSTNQYSGIEHNGVIWTTSFIRFLMERGYYALYRHFPVAFTLFFFFFLFRCVRNRPLRTEGPSLPTTERKGSISLCRLEGTKISSHKSFPDFSFSLLSPWCLFSMDTVTWSKKTQLSSKIELVILTYAFSFPLYHVKCQVRCTIEEVYVYFIISSILPSFHPSILPFFALALSF